MLSTENFTAPQSKWSMPAFLMKMLQTHHMVTPPRPLQNAGLPGCVPSKFLSIAPSGAPSKFFSQCAPTNWRELAGQTMAGGLAARRRSSPAPWRDGIDRISYCEFLSADGCESWSRNSKLFARNIDIAQNIVYSFRLAVIAVCM